MRQIHYPRSFYSVGKHGSVELSAKAAERLRRVKAWRALTRHGLASQEAADTQRLPRSTPYRWEGRRKAEGSPGLEDRSRRRRQVRQGQWWAELAVRVRQLQENRHGWGIGGPSTLGSTRAEEVTSD